MVAFTKPFPITNVSYRYQTLDRFAMLLRQLKQDEVLYNVRVRANLIPDNKTTIYFNK